jgi:hypothetical protein
MEQLAATSAAPPDTSSWYQTQYGCLRTDPTLIARYYSFPDVVLPRAPKTPAPASQVCGSALCRPSPGQQTMNCVQYDTAWPMERIDSAPLVTASLNHPQFAFHTYGPVAPGQMDMESSLRGLDLPISRNQAVLPLNGPLFQSMAPPPVTGLPEGVQNACNPVAAMVTGRDSYRESQDAAAMGASNRLFNNPTLLDTAKLRPRVLPDRGQPYYS